MLDPDPSEKSEQTLRAATRSWQAVFDNSSVGVALTDAAGRFLSVNAAYEKMLGYTSDELRSLTWRDVTKPEDVAANELVFNELWQRKRERFQIEKRYSLKDGEPIWVRLNSTLAPSTTGDPQFAVTIVEDISERKRLGEQLEREQKRLRLLLDLYVRFTSKLDLQELFAAVTDSLSDVEGWEYGFVDVAGPPGDVLRIRVLHDRASGLIQDGAIVHDGTAFDVYRSGTPGIFRVLDSPAPTGIQRIGEIKQRLLSEGYQVIAFLPLVHFQRKMGVLGMFSRKPYATAGHDLDFLKSLADLIALALNNVMRYGEANETTERLTNARRYVEEQIRADYRGEETVCVSPALQNVMKQVDTVAPTDSTVLIIGETGTGKELVARAIHDRSERRKRSFIKVDCTVIPAALMESELFGHERGAFTGAVARKLGRLEVADKGTLFLDEISDLPLELQPKLLRVLQDRVFERVGSPQPHHLDVRIIAAANRNLQEMVDKKQFRGDLYYRLNVFPIEIPPLRERREDILPLVQYYVNKYAHRMKKVITNIPQEALDLFGRYQWPGNVRELQHFMERCVILSSGSTLNVPLEGMRRFVAAEQNKSKPVFPQRTLEEIERESILQALQESGWAVGGPHGAAIKLGLKRTTLASRMHKLGISRRPL